MKSLVITICAPVCLMLAVNSSQATIVGKGPQPLFKYVRDPDPGKAHCQNAKGETGLNPGYLGDCGDMKKADLSHRTLKDLSLRGADLSGADLTQMQCVNCNLEAASLNQATLDGSSFRDASFRKAELRAVHAEKADFTGSDFTRANLSFSTINQSVFDQAHLTGLVVYHASARATRFEDADLTLAIATQSDFTFSNFRKATLDQVNFTESTLHDADFSESMGHKTNLDSVSADRTTFAGSVLIEVSLQKALLNEVDFSTSTFSRGTFFQTRFKRCRFDSSHLAEGNFIQAEFDANVFIESDLRNADFRSAKLQAKGWDRVRLNGSVVGPKTEHSFSPAELRSRKMILSLSEPALGLMIPGNRDLESYIRFPLEALEGLTVLRNGVSSTQDVVNGLIHAESYIVPYLDSQSRYIENPEVVELFRNFVEVKGRRLFIFGFGGDSYFLENLLGIKPGRTDIGRDYAELQAGVAEDFSLSGMPDRLYSTYGGGTRWSALPLGSRVLYGNRKLDTALLYMVPKGKGQVWSFAEVYGNGQFRHEDHRNDWKIVLKKMGMLR